MTEGSGYSRAAVFDALRRLVAWGYLEVEEEGGGRGKATVYRIPGVMADDWKPSSARTVSNGPNSPASTPKQSSYAEETVQPAGGAPFTTTENPNGTNVVDLTTEARALCELLADLVEQNGSKRPTITAEWSTEAERMLRIDKRDPRKAERLIRWCQADPFWRSNVLSMPKFRAKYDQLRLRANEEAARSDGRAMPMTDALAVYRAAKSAAASA